MKKKGKDPSEGLKKGALHKEMGIPQGKPIATSTLKKTVAKAKKSGNVKEERRAVQALNFRKGGKKK